MLCPLGVLGSAHVAAALQTLVSMVACCQIVICLYAVRMTSSVSMQMHAMPAMHKAYHPDSQSTARMAVSTFWERTF